ncbi:2-deoxy-scyllo-inosose synthase [Streptomyces sp. NPDC087300]|uniref:2-deoxy-scyllo-inosose synthase n=1 Tax=Streptomyces sp. NPDC087300 TaxID=3365780 RepID=UPI003813A6A8
MQVTTVTMDDVQYPYRLGTDCLDDIVTRLGELGASRYLVVSDPTVAELYGQRLCEELAALAGPAELITHPSGERNKGLPTLHDLAEEALRRGADRQSIVVALGGGVTGNIAGLLAALLFRGIRLVHVPTTVVAMLDSVLSLKQAVNAGVGKNLVGTFYQPVEVLADTAMLRTLPVREIRSGMCEVVKNSLAIRPSMIDQLSAGLRPDGRYPDDTMRWIIYESLAAKAQVTAYDKYERGEGLVLEYGHTVGHAVEHSSQGAVPHGAAVGLGMIAAARVSHRSGWASAELVELHRELVGKTGVALHIPSDVSLSAVRHRLAFDNKRGYLPVDAASYPMVLLESPGKVLRSEGTVLTAAPRDLVDSVVDELARAPRPGGRSADAAVLDGAR